MPTATTNLSNQSNHQTAVGTVHGIKPRNTPTKFTLVPLLPSPIWRINGLAFWWRPSLPFAHATVILSKWDWKMPSTLASTSNWVMDGSNVLAQKILLTNLWRWATSHLKLNLRMVPCNQSLSQLRPATMKLTWSRESSRNCKSIPKLKTWSSASTTKCPSQNLTTAFSRPWNHQSPESVKPCMTFHQSQNILSLLTETWSHFPNLSAKRTNTSKSSRPPTSATVMPTWDTISESLPWATKSPDPTRWENGLPARTSNAQFLLEPLPTTQFNPPSPSTKLLSALNCSTPKRLWLSPALTWPCSKFKLTKEQRIWLTWFKPACTINTTTLLRTTTTSNHTHHRAQAQAAAQAQAHQAQALHHHLLLLHPLLIHLPLIHHLPIHQIQAQAQAQAAHQGNEQI